MSKLTIIGDTHAKNENINQLNALFKLVEELGNNCVWLGDLLDTKEVVRSKCLNAYYDYFSSSKLSHTVLVGNHDQHNLHTKEHALKPLSALKNVTIVDSVYNTPDMFVSFMAYHHNLEEFRKNMPKSKVLFMHQGVVGFDYGNGYLEQNGITLNDLKSYDLVLSGHFHSYQTKGNLVYLGSPYTHAFGETNPYSKYLAVLDVNTLDLELLQTHFPRHVTATISAVKTENLRQYVETLCKTMTWDNDHLRLIVEGEKNIVREYINIIKDLKPNCKIIARPNLILKDKILDETEDNVVKFEKWAKNIKQFDKDIIDLGVKLLK